MKSDFIGDSYDLVKRHWRIVLSAHGIPLYFDTRFVPKTIWPEYSRATTIGPAPDVRPDRYAILNDPHTGVLLSTRKGVTKQSHATIDDLARQFRAPGVACSITFDQSFTRSALAKEHQRREKLEALQRSGVIGFYYASHASFLFAFRDEKEANLVRQLIIDSGIPERLIESSHGPFATGPRSGP